MLRDQLGRRGAKDGCSPQGQCGCCTVWVDGQPRVACVTPARRVARRQVTTIDGLPAELRRRWAEAFGAHGASQCGFCTPGIIMRLAGLAQRRPLDEAAVRSALLAHLCRCTGWNTIVEAALVVGDAPPAGHVPDMRHESPAGHEAPVGHLATTVQRRPPAAQRDLDAAERRAGLEGRSVQQVGPAVALGQSGFADDTAPDGSLIAVPDGQGGWALGASLAEARRRAGKVQGRNSTVALRHPLEVPPGEWTLTLRTTFVEPAYLEPDASWCRPGGEPASPLANGGAFGAKRSSPVTAAARRLADEHGRPVRVVFSREDVVRQGAKRPPIAVGIRPDGTGVLHVARTPGTPPLTGWAEALTAAAPGLQVVEVAVPGPPLSAELRAAGWAEGAVVRAALAAMGQPGPPGAGRAEVTSLDGARAAVSVAPDGVTVTVAAGQILDEVVLRSYCVGAVHQALSWVRSEGVAVSEDGTVLDLTIRSFGVLTARDMPPVTVTVEPDERPPVNGSDAVFAATAAATWLADGLPSQWPSRPGRR